MIHAIGFTIDCNDLGVEIYLKRGKVIVMNEQN